LQDDYQTKLKKLSDNIEKIEEELKGIRSSKYPYIYKTYEKCKRKKTDAESFWDINQSEKVKFTLILLQEAIYDAKNIVSEIAKVKRDIAETKAAKKGIIKELLEQPLRFVENLVEELKEEKYEGLVMAICSTLVLGSFIGGIAIAKWYGLLIGVGASLILTWVYKSLYPERGGGSIFFFIYISAFKILCVGLISTLLFGGVWCISSGFKSYNFSKGATIGFIVGIIGGIIWVWFIEHKEYWDIW